MKITVTHHNLRSIDELDTIIEEQIISFQPRLQIDEARVRLECRFDESPAFRAGVHLITPGPDVAAEGRDHTLRAAIHKVMSELEVKIGGRLAKRRRARGNREQPAPMRSGMSGR
jgi:ribosome-associated translation inhibitor RaiA